MHFAGMSIAGSYVKSEIPPKTNESEQAGLVYLPHNLIMIDEINAS